MKRFHLYEWNTHDREYSTVILTEEDIEKQDQSVFRGAGIDKIIMPKKYENIENEYLNFLREITTARCGEIIYI
jgi:hypothetical protein